MHTSRDIGKEDVEAAAAAGEAAVAGPVGRPSRSRSLPSPFLKGTQGTRLPARGFRPTGPGCLPLSYGLDARRLGAKAYISRFSPRLILLPLIAKYEGNVLCEGSDASLHQAKPIMRRHFCI